MNSDHVATIREALVMMKNHHLFSSGCSTDELEKMNVKIAAVNAALAALDEGASVLATPERIAALEYILANSLDEYNITFAETQAQIDVLRAMLEEMQRPPAQG